MGLFDKNVFQEALPPVMPGYASPSYNQGFSTQIKPGVRPTMGPRIPQQTGGPVGGGAATPMGGVKSPPIKVPAMGGGAMTPAQGGLLGMPGMRDGLLQGGAAMMQAGGNSRTPISMGQALSQGLQGFAQGQKDGIERDRKTEMWEYQKRTQDRMEKAQDGLVARYGEEAVLDPEGAMERAATEEAMAAFAADPAFAERYTPDQLKRINLTASTGDMDKVQKVMADIEKEAFDMEESYRNRIQPQIDILQDSYRAISGLSQSLLQKNGTGDIAAINYYQRMIDTGVVRGEDVKLQASATSFGEYLNSLKENIEKGDLLPQTVRDKISATAAALYKSNNSSTQIQVDGWKSTVEADPRISWGRIFPSSLSQFSEYGGSPSVAVGGAATGGGSGGGTVSGGEEVG